MVIYDINSNKILDANLSENAVHEEELGKTNLVRLSWQSNVKVALPAGSYIIPFDDGLKYRLLAPFTPTEDDRGFKYAPEFHHPLMWLSCVPFLYDTTDADKNPIKQQEWSYDGLTTNALEYVCKAINEALGITNKAEQFTFTLCGDVDASVSFSVSANDILSVLSSIAQACKSNSCEWHISWEHRALYFGQISINLGEPTPILKVHENVQQATLNSSKESYFNCFYPQGSTKNMSRKALVGSGNVSTLLRLGLDKSVYSDGCIYVSPNGEIITRDEFNSSNAIKQTLALSFDNVYPHVDLYAYNVRKRTRFLMNAQTGQVELDSHGNKRTYSVWYMRLAFPSTTRLEGKEILNVTEENGVTYYWYHYHIDKTKQVLQGYTLKGFFKVNAHSKNNLYDALSQSLVGQPNGQDGFELIYHEANKTIPANAKEGDSGVSVSIGDYEIKMYQSGDTIIPTNESEGLFPRGKAKPDFTCNIVVLFNIVMGDVEVKTAQEELARRTIKEIKRRSQDNNNYSFKSNAVEFANNNPSLYIGKKVIFDDGQGYRLSTRVLKLVTRLDYPIIQEIVVGNQAVKGTISQLKEDVNNILSGNFNGGGGLNSAQTNELIRNYVDTRFLRKTIPDTAQQQITFLKGLSVGGFDKGLNENGDLNSRYIKADAVKSDNFNAGVFDGSGFGMYKDVHGNSCAEVDILNVRKKATFSEVNVKRFVFTSGDQGFTSAGAKLAIVKPITNAFRCYFLADDGEKRIMNDWHIGDQAMCKTFNLTSQTSHGEANRYYWRLVVNKGEETINDKLYHYIDLSDIRGSFTLTINGDNYTCVGCDTSLNNDVPKAEDSIIQLGSQTDTDRQFAYIIYISEGKRVDYAGINDFDLSSHIINQFSPRGTKVRSDSFELVSSSNTGVSSPLVCDRGEWVSGTIAGHYDRFSYNGSLWLCNVGKGTTTTEAPSEGNTAWIKQVEKGEDGQSIAGADAEFYRIVPFVENAIINIEGKLKLTLSYNVCKIKGLKTSIVNTSSSSYHLSYRSNFDNDSVKRRFTFGERPSVDFTISYDLKKQDDIAKIPDYFIVSLWDGRSNTPIETRIVQVSFNKATWIKQIDNIVSIGAQNNDSISNLTVASDRISAMVKGLRNGVKNLINGELAGYSFHEYGWDVKKTPVGSSYDSNIVATLEKGKTYTVTVKGNISQELKSENRELVLFLFSSTWAWSKSVKINTTEKSISSLTFTTDEKTFPADGRIFIQGHNFPNKNGSVASSTCDWIVLTEGSVPASEYISNQTISDILIMLKNGEITLTAAKTKVEGLLLADYAKLGNAIFLNDYMFSQFGGVGAEASNGNYHLFDSANISKWHPNLLLNFLNGSLDAGRGKFHVDENGVRCNSGTFENIRITGNSLYAGILAKEKVVITKDSVEKYSRVTIPGHFEFKDSRFLDIFKLESTWIEFSGNFSRFYSFILPYYYVDFSPSKGATPVGAKVDYARKIVGNKLIIYNKMEGSSSISFNSSFEGGNGTSIFSISKNTFAELECCIGVENGYERIYWKVNNKGLIL